MGFVRVDGRWTKGRATAVEEEEHAEGEDLSSPMPRLSPVDHPILEPVAGPSVRGPPSSHTMSSFSLGDDVMGQLAERVARILSIQQQRFQDQVLQQLHQFQQYQE